MSLSTILRQVEECRSKEGSKGAPMTIKRIWAVMKAEFIHIIRDPLSLIIALFMPLFLLFLSGYCICFELKEMPVAVFDMDQSRESRNYLEAIDNTS